MQIGFDSAEQAVCKDEVAVWHYNSFQKKRFETELAYDLLAGAFGRGRPLPYPRLGHSPHRRGSQLTSNIFAGLIGSELQSRLTMTLFG